MMTPHRAAPGRRPGLARAMILLLLVVPLVACSRVMPAGPPLQEPVLESDRVITADGYHLPLHRWYPDGEPEAIALAVHGFNDYGASFAPLARSLVERGIAVYAYDQRSFGSTAPRGVWPGQEALVSDLDTVARLLRERYPDRPLYLVGKSMGGAVTIATLTQDEPPPVDGAVLIAPAIWGREIMPWYQRVGLSLTRYVLPRLSFSGKTVSRIGVRPTDDPEVMRAQSRDPLVQKEARADVLYGLSSLMNTALARAPQLDGRVLMLYGDRDQVIPPQAMCSMLARLEGVAPWRMAVYPGGYHMLTRYTGAARTHADIAAWLLDPAAPLPSGDEVTRDGARAMLCGAVLDQA